MKILLSLIFFFSIISGFTQTRLTDPISGCNYWVPWNCDLCNFSWTGHCTDSLPEGNGILTISYNSEQVSRYEGEMKNGQFDGKGSYSDAQNNLDGYFKHGNFINFDESHYKKLQKNSLNDIDSTDIYVNDGESTELFYYALEPNAKLKGTLIIFPSSWEPAENVINNNLELIKTAFKENLLVIIPSINYNVCLNATSISFLNNVFAHMLNKYKPPTNKIVFGGFSLGGMNAIRYTQMAYENDSLTVIKPIAVYGVDPPLDLARLYRSFERTIEKNFSPPAIYEAQNYISKLTHEFGGSPEDVNQVYVKYSMFSKSEKDGGNAKFLQSIPVRIYCDPDIDWQLKERRMDYYDMNAVDQTAMINHLLLMGNENAEFINALGKGYRLDGRRHPHSWSIVDPEECMNWILENLK